MEKLILTYDTWNKYHPIIKSALLDGELVKIHPLIIKKESRLNYYETLDKAHTTGDYIDFVKLVNELEIKMLNKYLELL